MDGLEWMDHGLVRLGLVTRQPGGACCVGSGAGGVLNASGKISLLLVPERPEIRPIAQCSMEILELPPHLPPSIDNITAVNPLSAVFQLACGFASPSARLTKIPSINDLARLA